MGDRSYGDEGETPSSRTTARGRQWGKIESVCYPVAYWLKYSPDYPPPYTPLEQVYSPDAGNLFGPQFLHSLSYRDNDRRTSNFVLSVTKILTQCRHFKLKKFEAYIRCDIQFESKVNNWIRYAVRCNVEEIDLQFVSLDLDAEFIIHEQFFCQLCLANLTLRGCILIPYGAISWKMLKSLCISTVDLDKDLIQNILSGSPVLELLVLVDCYGCNRLDITSKSVKNLSFCGYMDPNDESDDLADVIEINAPSILSLEIQDDLLLWKLLLLDNTSRGRRRDVERTYTKTSPCQGA